MTAPDRTAPTPVPLADPDALVAAVASRYGKASRFAQGYVRSKLRRDPATAAILAAAEAAGGFGHLADLGCGRGQLALALLLAGRAESVAGLDLDAAKIGEAREAARGLPACFTAADLSRAPVPASDTVMLVDVLYQMPEAAQHALLGRVAAAARRRVVIRAFDPDAGWRTRVGRAMEVANRALRGAREASIRPLSLPALAAPLTAAGFAVRVSPCWAGTPLPNVLLVAERPA
ncbi:methyltransferase domain-containing protein [Roseomonas sp. OT10]|uniref:methyltransferase domain-containing protein n=1 Tax=Roseomonas cutis TaxID=2897332 RepID=UPI001E465A54|nr:class I SAM-dependent methyltransferase [Roseomonas sp. OT10]UFN48243.1 methyltransferase domain-containing protein [Roseomonas sp. OT10]